jgi:hypothetical protein
MSIDVYCNICSIKLFTIYGGGKIEPYEKDYMILCRSCYKEKDIEELTKIAQISSEIVIKDLAKIHKPKKEELV